MKNSLLKFVFGGIIFLFALALAYTTASYLDSGSASSSGYGYWNTHSTTYWAVLMVSGMVYIVIGMLVVNVFPVSLGFLFSADVLVLHTLGDRYNDIPSPAKLALVGVILFLLYLFAWNTLEETSSSLPASPSTPQVTQ